jgi:ParB family chromosome partitioning protein
MEPEGQAALVESIRQSGQQVPVLVRRIGHVPDRFQIAYGHRRVAACRQLGRRVLAIIRTLSDQELLVAQGQENSSRKDLSYIERAMFALNLEKRGVGRDAIMLALSTDKTELSKMISVARSVPADIVRSIGPAPKAGRTRWLALSQRLAEVRPDAKFRALLASAEFAAASTDARFDRVFGFLLAKPKEGAEPLVWANPEGRQVVRGARSSKAFTLTIDEAQEPGFGEFLLTHLGDLYETFRSRKAGPS